MLPLPLWERAGVRGSEHGVLAERIVSCHGLMKAEAPV